MKRRLFIFILLAAIITLSLSNGTAADNNKGTERFERIEVKLDQILMNQSEIFKKLDKIEQELAVVKLRATR